MRYHKLKAGECPGTYVVTEPVTEQDLLRIANQIARKRLAKGTAITSTTEAAERLQTLLQDREHEVFGALFLDSQHRVLAFEELFRGTLDSASIYPREVVKRALLLNCGAIIAVHYVARHIMDLMCPVSLCAAIEVTTFKSMYCRHKVNT
ncbi:JAB domain-containing protein [Aeromonas jandaei]|uniref:JAB domain-containing protein n=1 Tax=Aeromonas jandaei TaxID=650 RepID=UPI001F325E8A|nr:JAB domain-containing protein [Aeromonas jandaei]